MKNRETILNAHLNPLGGFKDAYRPDEWKAFKGAMKEHTRQALLKFRVEVLGTVTLGKDFDEILKIKLDKFNK